MFIKAKVGDLVWCPYVSCIAKMRFGLVGTFSVVCKKCGGKYQVEVSGSYDALTEE